MEKKRQMLVFLLLSLVLSAVSVFAQGQFDSVFGLLRALDPLYIYGIIPALIDFVIIFAIFFTVARISFMQRFGGAAYAQPMIVAVAIALAGGGVMFLRTRGLTLFSLLGNFSFFLVILLMGLFIYWAAGEPKGHSPSHVYTKAAVFLLIILVLFKAFFASQWNDIFPSQTLRAIVDLLIALGGLLFIIFGAIWFFKGIKGSFGPAAHGATAPHTGLFDIRPTASPFGSSASHPPATTESHAPAHSAPGLAQSLGGAQQDRLSQPLEYNINLLERLVPTAQNGIEKLQKDLGPNLVHASQVSQTVMTDLQNLERVFALIAQYQKKVEEIYHQYSHAGAQVPQELNKRFSLALSGYLPLIGTYRELVGRIVP